MIGECANWAQLPNKILRLKAAIPCESMFAKEVKLDYISVL